MILCFRIGDLKITNNFKNTLIDNENYVSNPSMQIKSNYIGNNFEPEKLLLEMANFPENITIFQGRRAEIFYFNSLEGRKFQMQKIIISKISKNENSFLLELTSLSDVLDSKKMNYFSEKCRAEFGDSLCGINRENFALSGKMEGFAKDFSEIYDNNLVVQNSDFFKCGKIWIEDFKDEYFPIFKAENKRIVLFFPLNFDLKIGMKYKLFMGCDKTVKMCKERYQNVLNFRGEPFIFEKFSSSSF